MKILISWTSDGHHSQAPFQKRSLTCCAARAYAPVPQDRPGKLNSAAVVIAHHKDHTESISLITYIIHWVLFQSISIASFNIFEYFSRHKWIFSYIFIELVPIGSWVPLNFLGIPLVGCHLVLSSEKILGVQWHSPGSKLESYENMACLILFDASGGTSLFIRQHWTTPSLPCLPALRQQGTTVAPSFLAAPSSGHCSVLTLFMN